MWQFLSTRSLNYGAPPLNSVTYSVLSYFYVGHSVWKSQKKVSFNIASELSYIYIGNTKNRQFLRIFENLRACSQKVLPDRWVEIGQKLVENAKIEKFKWDI